MFSVVLLSFTVITHGVTNTHSPPQTLWPWGIGDIHQCLFFPRLARHRVWAQGWGGPAWSLVTFEQPFRLPGAGQAQGALPRLNRQLKEPQPAVCRAAVTEDQSNSRRSECVNGGSAFLHRFDGCRRRPRAAVSSQQAVRSLVLLLKLLLYCVYILILILIEHHWCWWMYVVSGMDVWAGKAYFYINPWCYLLLLSLQIPRYHIVASLSFA